MKMCICECHCTLALWLDFFIDFLSCFSAMPRLNSIGWASAASQAASTEIELSAIFGADEKLKNGKG